MRNSSFTKPLFDHIALEEVVWKKSTIGEIIKKTRKYNFQKIDRDVIGAVYQKHISKDTRRRLGQFYTPPALIQHIIGQIPVSASQRIIDPACGSGGFLIALYDLLRKEMENTHWENGNIHDHLIQKVLYGIDIDTFAQQLTIMNLILKDLDRPEYIVNVADGDSLKFGLDMYEKKKPISELSTTKGTEYVLSANDILRENGYDVVVGNPPFVQIRNDSEIYAHDFDSFYKNIIDGSINSASLFVKKGLWLLKNKGYLGFVLPKSLLRVDSFQGIRNHILKNAKILSITDIGQGFEDVGYEVVTMILQKDKKNLTNKISVITDIKNLDSNIYNSYQIDQKLFKKLGVFAIYLNAELRSIVEKMNRGSVKLSRISDIWRGLGLSVNDSVVSEEKKSDRYEKLLRGERISRYLIKSYDYIDTTDKRFLTKYKEASKKLRTKKIVVQNIVSSKVRAVATYDEESCLNIDTITNVLVRNKAIEPKYVLGIMNSKLMTFYIRDVVFNRALLTMHMDAPYLGQIPIKEISKSKQNKLIEMVNSITHIEKRTADIGYDLYTSGEYVSLKEGLKNENRDIDNFVYDLYGLNEQQIQTVEKLITYW